MMDIKRSDRLRKTAAIAALVLAINSTGATAELGTTGFFDGDVVSAITISSTDFEIKSEADLKAFLDPGQTQKKRGIINPDEGETIEVSECLGNLTGEKIIYGNGKTITITSENGKASPLFNEIESGSRIENVNIKTAPSVHVESDTTVGAVCRVNNGEIRYVTVDAKVKSASNQNHDNALAGIICGENNGKIFGCIADGTLDTQNNYAGSLCGKNNKNGNIERCSCPATINFSDNSKFIGGFCGYNSGKIYDCIFEGYLPHSEWSQTYINSNSTDKASKYRNRKIGAFSGELDTTTGYIQNSLYNGRINLTENEYKLLTAKNEYKLLAANAKNGVIADDKAAPKDFFCNGNYGVDDKMANTYRIDTYTYNDETETKTIICHAHYHDKKYGDNQLKNITASEYTKENGTVKYNLNKGSDAQRPTTEEREGDIWVDGDVYPQLNLKPDEVVEKIKANNRFYDGKPQPLIKEIGIEKGFGTIEFLDDDNNWSENIPEATNAGDYTVYYRVKGGSGYHNIPEDFDAKDVKYPSVSVKISPRKLKIQDIEVPYTGKPYNITPVIDKNYTSAEEPEAYGLVDGETCKLLDIHFMQDGRDKDVKEKGEYTISAKAGNDKDEFNGNYEIVDGTVNVTDSESVSIAAPSASDITYGQTLSESNLSALSDSEKAFALGKKKWEWVNMSETPRATQENEVQTFKARLKVDPNFDYSNLGKDFRLSTEASTEVSYEGTTDTYIYTDVPVQVNKRTLNVIWTDPADKKYTYNGKPIYPSYKIEDKNDNNKTGYLNGKDKEIYKVKLVPASEAYNCIDSKDQEATVVFDYDTTQYKENYVLNVKPKKYHIDKNILTAIEDINIEVPYGKDKEGNVTDIAYIRNQLDKKLKEQIGENYGKYQIVSEFNIKDDEGNNLPDDTLLNVCENTYDCEITYILKNDVKTDANNEGTFIESVKMIPSAAEPKVSAINREYNGEEKDLVKLDNGDCNGLSAEYTVYLKDADGNKTLFYQGTDIPKAINAGTYVVDYSLTCTDGNHTLSDDVASGSVDVTVSPKEVTLEWNGKPQYTYGETVNISAKTKNRDDICDSDVKNGLKLVVAVPDGIVPDDYKATASIDSTNYKVINPEYSYKIVKATLTITWDETVFTYEPGKQQIPNADVTGFKYDDKNKFPYTVEVTKGDGITAGKHTASVKFKDKDELEKRYNVTYSDHIYPIGQKGTDERISLPSASPIMYGEQVLSSVLSDTTWSWPSEGPTERPDAGVYRDAPVERKRDPSLNYPSYDPKIKVNEAGDKFTGKVDVEVEKRPLEVVWGNDRKFTYNGAEQYPSFSFKTGEKTGYINADEDKYTVKVIPESGYDGKSAGKQKATVVFSYTDETLPDNYYIVVKPVEYEIAVKSIRDIGDVETTVTYGDTSSVKAVREALKAEILKKNADFDKNYVILDDFSVKNMKESDVLDAATYTSKIRYTCVEQDAATGASNPNLNFEGWFDAKVTVVPKQIMVQWKTNTTYNESLERNEIEYDEKNLPEVTPDLEKGALCERDKDEELTYSTSPEGYNVGNYTVKASLDDSNYELYNDVFTYTVTKGKAEIKITDILEATYGDPVSSVKLPENKEGTFKWKNPDELVGDVGDREHDVIFIPNEGSNYKETELKVTVKVYPKDVHLIWNIENGHEFTFSGSEQNVTVRADLRDVYDDDEKEFAASFTADNLVNAGSHEAKGVINNSNYKIVKGTESRNFKILPSSDLKPMSYYETYEYGTTAKEIFDDLFAKHFGDFSAFAEQYSVDPESVEVYKNGKKIDTAKLKNYAKSCLKAQDLIFDGDIVDQLNSLGRSFYNKPDFNVLNNYNDYMQVKTLVDTNRDRIKSFINAGVLPEADKYRKLVTLFEKYEAVKEAENVMQEVGDYKIVVNYNRMADEKEQSLTRFLKLSNNYHPATLTTEVKITPRVINSIFADIDSRPYDGTTDLNKVNGYTFYSEKNGEKKSWTVGGYHTINCQFVSPDAGTDKIDAEIVLTNENFCFGYDYKTGEPVKSKKFYSAETDGCITKAEFPYTVNLEGFAGERLSTIAVPSIIHGTFKWNDTETLIVEGANDVAASEFTFTPDSKDKFNSNYDMKLTVKVNGIKKPVETVVETAVETIIVTGEPQPAVTEDTGKPVTTAETETTTKTTEAATTPAGTETTPSGETTAVTTTVTETKAETTASTSGAVTTTVTETETTTAGVTKADTTDLPEITVPASTTAKLMGEVTDAPVIVTKPVTSADTKAETTAAVTTAKTEVTKKAETTAAVTTAKTEETKAVTTAATTGAVTSAETTVSTATVTLAETTKAAVTSATAAETTANASTEAPKAETTAAATTAKTEETKAVTTAVTTAAVTTAETTVSTATVTTKAAAETTANASTEAPKAETTAAATTSKTEETKAVTTAVTTNAVTSAETTVSTATVTLAETTANVTTAKAEETKAATESTKPSETEATKAATTAKTEAATTVTTAGVTTAEVTAAETTVAETTAVTEPKATEAETTAATTTVTEVTAAETTSEVTEAEVTPAATLPTLPDITLPEVTTDKLMGDVTEAEVTTSEDVTTAAVTTPAVTEETKTDLDKIREIIINEPEKVNKEVREDDKISIDGEEIKLSLEDKMFFQGTESFDYPVRLKDFNAEKAYFDYAGFGFELPAGFTVDPESLSTDLKGNIKYYAPDSIEALSLVLKTGYTANGGYVVFRGVETRNLAPDAVLFTVKVKAADTLNVCVSRIGVSALYGRLTENSKFAEDGKVEPHVAFIDNGAGEQLYTKADSSVRMGIKGDVNLDGKVSQVDATIILREILSLEVAKESLLADNINVHEGTAAEAVELSHFLGNVNQSPNGLFTQIDATSILRGILERDINNTGIVTEEIWKKVTNK